MMVFAALRREAEGGRFVGGHHRPGVSKNSSFAGGQDAAQLRAGSAVPAFIQAGNVQHQPLQQRF
jgi:hypothetical protein